MNTYTTTRAHKPPYRVSCHGDSTIIIDDDGWVTGQVPRAEADAIARRMNAAASDTLPQVPAAASATGRCCGGCRHFAAEKPKTARYDSIRGGWCKALEMATAPQLLRCGGDDYEAKEAA